MAETPTCGRCTEIPYEQMMPEQQEAECAGRTLEKRRNRKASIEEE